MTTVTISDVNVAVNKAFEAGLSGQAYEGLMPSAHDAGVHIAQSDESPGLRQQFLAILLNAASDGFQDGAAGAMPRTGYYNPGGPILNPLGLADVQAVYSEGFLAGSSNRGMDWTPWLIGGGIAAAAVVVGVVVISRTASSNPSYDPSWLEPESYKTLYDGLDAARQYATATGNRYYVGVGIGLRGASVHPRSSRVDSEGLYFEVNSNGDIRYIRQDRRGKYKEAWKGSDLDAASAAGKRMDATSWKVAA